MLSTLTNSTVAQATMLSVLSVTVASFSTHPRPHRHCARRNWGRRLWGGSDSELIGGAGADKFRSNSGGSGFISYAGSALAVNVNLDTGAASGGDAAGDTFIGFLPRGFQGLVGSSFNDTLTFTNNTGTTTTLFGRDGNDTLNTTANDGVLEGGNGNDTLNGGANRQTLRGGAGNNTLNGGDGFDTASYFGATAGIAITIGGPAGNNGFGGLDTLNAIEKVTGTSFNNSMTGDANDNTFVGFGGNNTVNGGGGIDTVDYTNATAAVSLTIGGPAGNNGFGGLDTLSNVENLIGSKFNDTLIGNALDNTLAGLRGRNTLNGGAGIDTVSYALVGSVALLDVDLQTGTARNGLTGDSTIDDTLIGFENAIASFTATNCAAPPATTNSPGGRAPTP